METINSSRNALFPSNSQFINGDNLELYRPSSNAIRRLAVIDGMNMMHASNAHRRLTSCPGLLTLVRYFIVRNFNVHVFVPRCFANGRNENVVNAEIIPLLRNIGLIEYTFARPASDNRPGFRFYDDLSVIEDAQLRGGFIVSGDRYDDIIAKHPQYRTIICERKLQPWWDYISGKVENCGCDRFVFAKPSISSRNRSMSSIDRILYCLPNDPSFAIVQKYLLKDDDRNKLILEIDKIIDHIAQFGNARALLSQSIDNNESLLTYGYRSIQPRRQDSPFVFYYSTDFDEKTDELIDDNDNGNMTMPLPQDDQLPVDLPSPLLPCFK